MFVVAPNLHLIRANLLVRVADSTLDFGASLGSGMAPNIAVYSSYAFSAPLELPLSPPLCPNKLTLLPVLVENDNQRF